MGYLFPVCCAHAPGLQNHRFGQTPVVSCALIIIGTVPIVGTGVTTTTCEFKFLSLNPVGKSFSSSLRYHSPCFPSQGSLRHR